MLKKKSQKKPEFMEISDKLWKKLMGETLQGILKLLGSAEILLENGGNEAICAGLYTYALEEYGKLLLLKQYSPSAGKVKIKYKNEFLKHPPKFNVAIANLPPECLIIDVMGFEEGFEEGFERIEVAADFEARTAVFYCDVLDSGDGIKSVPSVDKTRLGKAIDRLRIITFGTDVNT
jgi:AbiV family abortive infection protein